MAEIADAIVIAPATANIIAKIANGMADDMLTTTVLACRSPVIIVPAMHTQMYQNPITQENEAKLKGRGFYVIPPESGRLASGGYGPGRFPETKDIIGHISKALGKNGKLAGKRITVTAGGNQEPIDPVRVITNRSSGKMGYALAEAARDRGAHVTLITSPTALSKPAGIEVMPADTAIQMKEAVEKAVRQADVLIMAAAVADYRVKDIAENKIKRDHGDLTLALVNTPDILSQVNGDFLKIGFAAESQNLVENARQKLDKKNLDLIIANDITEENSGFGSDTNKVTMLDRAGGIESLPVLSKRDVAERIMDKVVLLLGQKAISVNRFAGEGDVSTE